MLADHRAASKRSGTEVPATLPVTRKMLLDTHGMPGFEPDTSGKYSFIASWRLEAPGMFMNHSCDPNMIETAYDSCNGESIATRLIRKGEEITCNYNLEHYDDSLLPYDSDSDDSSSDDESEDETCECGSKNCWGPMTGFKTLSNEVKEELLPISSECVQAWHGADKGESLPIKVEQKVFPPRPDAPNGYEDSPRMVFPGPSAALADIEIKKGDTGKFALYASKDVAAGKKIYEFWEMDWPFGGTSPINMVAPTKIRKGDLPEGTIVCVDPFTCSAAKDRSGHFKFAGFDLLTEHCCEPNVTYNVSEGDDWQKAYAAKAIKAGDKLTVDLNSILWDRSNSPNAENCFCSSTKCVGHVKGFKQLSYEEKMVRAHMTWKCVPVKKCVGEALSPNIRVNWRANSDLGGDCPLSSSSSESSSSDEE